MFKQMVLLIALWLVPYGAQAKVHVSLNSRPVVVLNNVYDSELVVSVPYPGLRPIEGFCGFSLQSWDRASEFGYLYKIFKISDQLNPDRRLKIDLDLKEPQGSLSVDLSDEQTYVTFVSIKSRTGQTIAEVIRQYFGSSLVLLTPTYCP